MLTPSGLKFMASIQNSIKNTSAVLNTQGFGSDPEPTYPSYSDVCLKVPKNSSIFPIANITEDTPLECAEPSSPLL